MAGIDPSECPGCGERYTPGRVLNRTEVATGAWGQRVAACASCLTVTRFVSTRYDERVNKKAPRIEGVSTLATGAETARFLESLAAARESDSLASFHERARGQDTHRWLLRLPEAVPHVRAMFPDGGTLIGDVFGMADVHAGCVLLESWHALPGADTFRRVPGGPGGEDALESATLGITLRHLPRGSVGAPARFAKGAPAPKAIERFLCLTFARGPSGGHELLAVPPDLLLPA